MEFSGQDSLGKVVLVPLHSCSSQIYRAGFQEGTRLAEAAVHLASFHKCHRNVHKPAACVPCR